jgi:hypothetical protein
MKGCNEIQAMGAMMTYIRRYLYVNALEIVEHDAIDATAGKESGVHKPTKNSSYNPDEEEVTFLLSVVDGVKAMKEDYSSASDYLAGQNLDSDEKVWVWDKLDSKVRSGIKKYNEVLKAKEQ